MKAQHQALYKEPKYKSFINDRNKALERLQSHCQKDVSRVLHGALEKVSGFVSHMILTQSISIETLKPNSQLFDRFVHETFSAIELPLEDLIKRLKRSSYYLSYLGELEGVARATRKTFHADPFQFKRVLKDQEEAVNILGKPVSVYVYQSLFKLRTRIVSAFISAVSLEKAGDEILESIEKVYPEVKVYKIPPRNLKPLDALKEADSDPKDKKEFDFYHDLTNDEDWDLAVQAYKDSSLPPSRFDKSASYNDDTGTMQYSWELEQDITDDFVKQVRDGQIQAANDLGVKDFVWVSVIDSRTCEVCCMPRAGKLVSEIEAMLKSGALDAEECDASVPPAHPNCRCDISPVASTDPVPGPDWKSFQDWLDA